MALKSKLYNILLNTADTLMPHARPSKAGTFSLLFYWVVGQRSDVILRHPVDQLQTC